MLVGFMGFLSLVSCLDFLNPWHLSLSPPTRGGCLSSKESTTRQPNTQMLGVIKNTHKETVHPLLSLDVPHCGSGMPLWQKQAIGSHGVPGSPRPVESIPYGNFIYSQSSQSL